MKTIVIFCRSLSATGHPFRSDYYRKAYIDLLLSLKQRGVEAYFATHGDYLGAGRFAHAYTVDSRQPLEAFTKATNVTADLVFDRGGFEETDVPVLNPPFVRAIAANKQATLEQFGHYQPRSRLVRNAAELEEAFAALPGERVVVKAPEGNGGNFVVIGSRTEARQALPGEFPLIVQEFMDTAAGIPGLVKGVHDLRVEIGGGEIWGGTLRTPAPGELRANVAQGGSRRRLTPDEIPEGARKLALEIDQHFQDYPRHYASDFALSPDGWRLLELNNNPGLSPIDLSPEAAYIVRKLADYLIAVCPELG